MTVVGHNNGVMDIDSYVAVESKTGDKIFGVLYDNTGRYTIASSVTASGGPDNLGGTWTYTITNIGRADAVHQDASYSGFAYDFDYFDADTGKSYSTFYGHTGFNLGIADKVFFSGNNYLGSDGDLVLVNGRFFGIASGKYVVPEGQQTSAQPVMEAVNYQAQESVTGDVITGVLFDNASLYTVGSSVTAAGTDQLGGHWTYTVSSIADADAKHQDASYNGFAYDLTYLDSDLGQTVSTFYGSTGFFSGVNDRTANYSGNGGLGSDGDLVTINHQIFGIASGVYVVPEPAAATNIMDAVYFTAVESTTGDLINGVLFDNTGRYTVGSSVTTGPDQRGGTWTYTVNSIVTADSAHQNAAYTGFVYDLTYFDADNGSTFNTFYGSTGLTTGVNDRTVNYSGNNYLGSDGDLVLVNGQFFGIASGKYVLPDPLPSHVVPAGAEPVSRIDPITVGVGATVEVGQSYSGTATFAGTTGTLQLDRSADSNPQISGFGGSDHIDLRDIGLTDSTTLGYAANSAGTGGTLTVSDGVNSANLALIGNYTAGSFAMASDNQGGTLITDPPPLAQALMTSPHA